jgi:hypothetical protein
MECPSPSFLFGSRLRSCCHSSVGVLEASGLNLRTVAMKPQNCEERKNLELRDLFETCLFCDVNNCTMEYFYFVCGFFNNAVSISSFI